MRLPKIGSEAESHPGLDRNLKRVSRQIETDKKDKMQNAKLKIKKKESLKELKTLVDELTHKWKRAVADYRNLEIRMAKEEQGWVKYGNQTLLLQILEVVDDLERAAEHIKDNGVEIILEKLKGILRDNGVEEIKVGGFNPELMECVEMVGGEDNKVVSVEQKGYLYDGKLLRPAKVKVGKDK